MKLRHSILFLILLLGAFFRLYRIDVKMRFIWDEGRDMLAIRRMIVNRHPTLFGPYNEINGRADFFGVFHYYLISPALVLANYDPLGPSVFTALLGIVSIMLSYLLVKKWSNEKTALVVSALYAVSPGVIKYVQWAWNPNTIPLFALLFFLAISQLKRTLLLRFSAISGLLLGILLQLHYFTIVLGIAWFTVLISSRRRWRTFLTHVLIFLASFILPNLSFVLFDITHEHFFLHILQKSFINGGRQQLFQPSISSFFTVPLQYLTSVFQEVFKAPQFIAVCLSVIFILILFRTLVVFYRKKEITLQTLFAISWIVFILQISFFPASFDAYHSSSLWIGMIYLFVEPLLKRNPLFMLAVGVVFLFLLSNNDINRKPTWSENMPLVRTVSFIAAEDSKVLREPFNVASFTDSDTRATRYRYFLDVAGVVPMDIFNYQNVKHLYIFTPHTFEETVQNPAWELDAFRSGKTTFLGKSDDVSVYRIDR